MSAFLACFGLPRFLFSPMGTSFAAGGGFADLRRIAKPIMCLHMYFLRKNGQVHFPSFHFSLLASLGKVTFHTLDALFLNWSNVPA